MRRKIIISLLIVALIAVGAYIFMPKSSVEDKPQFNTSKVKSANVTQSITATGTVEPVTLVDVGTQVSGILTNLYVDYNSVVKEGEVIAELDKSTLELDLNSRKNDLLVAESKLQFESANYARIKTLFDKELIADSEYETALYSYETAKNNYQSAKNDLQRSETNLGYATIYSPIDGIVLSRSVEEGQTVASSFNTPTLFTIAADLKDMQVIANVDEADIGGVKEGQRAKFMVDAFPSAEFYGTVKQVRQEAIIESNVVTYEVVITAANPDLKLKPGLTANIEIFTLDINSECVISSSALQFTPPVPANGEVPQKDGDMVWIKRGDSIEPRKVVVEANNGIVAAIKEGLSLGEEVVIGMSAGASKEMPKMEGGAKSPFVQQRPGPRN